MASVSFLLAQRTPCDPPHQARSQTLSWDVRKLFHARLSSETSCECGGTRIVVVFTDAGVALKARTHSRLLNCRHEDTCFLYFPNNFHCWLLAICL